MNQFIARVAHYVANEIIVKGLSNSTTFQKFVVRTDATIRAFQKTGTEKLNSTFDELLKNAAGSSGASYNYEARYNAGPPPKPLRGIPGFISAFVKEIRKDLGIGT